MATAANDSSSTEIKDELNILLLGETGIGKSTFINSLFNYLHFETFKDACQNNNRLQCLIPTKFSILDEQFNTKVVEFGSNDNENIIPGESATLKPKSYIFDVPKYNRKLRIIDTPGVGDTRGIIQDDCNQKNIIHYLSSISYLHGICIFLKPNQPRCTIMFQHCITQLLLYLHKTAISNIIFIFTNTGNSFFTPGETTHSLQKVLKCIEEKQKIIIPFSRKNTVCIDNESFRYLLAKKSNINLGNEDIFSSSYSHSRHECWRIINYAMSATPYALDSTVYVYKVRQTFDDLCHSLTDTLGLLKKDSCLLKKLYAQMENDDLTEVRDTKNRIEEVEERMCKYENERNNLNLQVSKMIIYLQTNSIIVFNDCIQGYVSYLIDTERSKGVGSDRKQIRDYHNMINYYESIKQIIDMDIHVDPFSPVIAREELSSIFPQLKQELKIDSDNKLSTSEVLVLHDRNSITSDKKDDTPNENNSKPFTFGGWFDIITDSVQTLTNNLQESADYETFRKHSTNQEHIGNMKNDTTNKFTKFDSNYHKAPFNKNPRSRNKSKNSEATASNTATYSVPLNREHMNKKSDQTFRNSKLKNKSASLNFLDQLTTDNTDQIDDFVRIGGDSVLNEGTQQSYPRGAFRGRGRGRGRGNKQFSKAEHNVNPNKQFGKEKNWNVNPSKQLNARQFRAHQYKQKSNEGNTTVQGNDPDIPKNVLLSMKNIFD